MSKVETAKLILVDVEKDISSVENQVDSVNNQKRVASQQVREYMHGIRLWIQMRENDLLGMFLILFW